MQITLTPVTRQDISEVLDLWDGSRHLDGQAQHALLSKAPASPFHHWITRKNDEPTPIRTVLSIVQRRYDAFGILEGPYLDLEFWDSYVEFYATSFSHTSRECKRLHLFSGDETKVDDLLNLLKEGKTQQQILDAGFTYRGYCVFRPISSNVVGRCAIEFDAQPVADLLKRGIKLRDGRPGRPFLKVEQICKAVLLNTEFRFKAAEFIQQDPCQSPR